MRIFKITLFIVLACVFNIASAKTEAQNLHHIELIIFVNKDKSSFDKEDLQFDNFELNLSNAERINILDANSEIAAGVMYANTESSVNNLDKHSDTPKFANVSDSKINDLEIVDVSFDREDYADISNSKQHKTLDFSQNKAPYYLSSSEWNLNEYVNKLNNDKSKKVVLHQAWIQDLDLNKQSPKILIDGNDAEIASVDSYNKELGEIQGLLSFKNKKGFYLAQSEFAFKEYKTFGRENIYHLKSSGRIKPNKLYYFDHPAFGVLLYISPKT